MGTLLDNAKKNRENQRVRESVGNSTNNGFLATTRAKRQQEKLNKQLNVVTDMYNRSQSDLQYGTDTYSNQAGYRNRMNDAYMVSHMGDMTKKYVSSLDNSFDKQAINNYIDSIQNNIREQNNYRENLGKYMLQFQDEDDFNNYHKYSGKSQTDIDEKINSLNQLITGDVNNPGREDAIKERDWLYKYYNSNINWLSNRNSDDIKAQIDELDYQIEGYRQKMNEASAMAGIQAMTYDDAEYQESLANKQRAADYQALMESAQAQRDFLQSGYDTAKGYQAYLDAQKRIEELKAEGYTPSENYGESAASSAVSGAWDAMVNSTNAFLDMKFGEPMRWLESNWNKYLGDDIIPIDLPGEQISDLYEYSKSVKEKDEKQRELDNYYYNSGIEQLGLGLSNAIGSAIPLALTSVMSGVASTATAAKSVAEFLKALAKNPQFWASFVTMAGSTYDSAIEEGASYDEAVIAALTNGSLGAVVEIGGGIETKLTNSNTFENWLKSALEEGGEEVIQGVLENGFKKLAYDPDRAVISMNDENAIINPARMAQEFGYGALAGGILSGAGMGVNSAVNAGVNAYQQNKAYSKIGQDIKGSESLDAYTQYAMDNKLIKGADKISAVKMGKVAEKVETDIKQSMMNASSLKELTDAYDKVSKYNDSALTAIATHYYIRKVREIHNSVTSENSAHTGEFTANATTSMQNSENVQDKANNHTDKGTDGSAQTADVITPSGNKSSITGIVEVSDGDAVVSLSDGTIAKVSELEITNKEFAKVWAYALSHNNTNLAKNITRNYVMQTYADDYIHNYKNMFSVGRMGLDYKAYEAITEYAENRIGVDVAYSAYSFGNGKFGTEETVEAVKPSKKSKAQYSKEEGVQDSPMDTIYEGVSKKLGIEIKKVKKLFAGEDAEANAQLVVAAASIMVSENADNEYANFIHELGEGVLAYNPKAYADLRKAILEYAVVSEGVDSLDQLIKKKQKMYAEVEGDETYTEAMNEVVNDILGGIFANDEGVKQFTDWLKDKSGYSVKEQKTFLQKLCDLLKSIADAIKNFIKSGKVNEANIIGLKMQGKRAMEIRSQFLKALEGMKENIEQGNVVEVSDSVKYSVKDYNTSIDEIWNGTKDFEASHIYVCDTPQFLVDIGFRKLPMLMTKKHVITDMFTEEEAKNKGYKVKKDAHFHGMGEELMKKIPEMLNEPVMIIKHTDSPFDTEIGILTNQTDKNGNLIIIGITPNADGYISVQVGGDLFKTAYKETNRINTAYGNDKIKMFLKSAKQEGRILFYDKRKSQVINSILRVLFPNNLDKLDFSKNLAQYSTLVKGVNAGYTKNSLKDSEGTMLTPAQIDYFKDSKVRDENGNLLVVYHGTARYGFTVFNRNVNYFSDNLDVAKTYSKNNGVYKEYLNITNPIVIEGNNEKWSMIAVDNITIDGVDDVKSFLRDWGASTWNEKGKLRTSTADIVGAISDAVDDGSIIADGIIIKNIYDEGTYSDSVGKYLGNDYITFRSNQAKNTDNLNPTEDDDIRYSLKDSKGDNNGLINTLTGKPVSRRTLEVLDILDKGKNVDIDTIKSLPEIKEAKERVKAITNEFIRSHTEFENIPINQIGTYLIDTEERKALRESIINKRLNDGSFSHIDGEGKEVYNGIAKKGKRLDIVIGLPASGKSSSLVNPLSEYYKSLVIDSDIVKTMLPEFNDGWGAGIVHEESKIINTVIYQRAIDEGCNIVLPIVGSSVRGIEEYIKTATDDNYDIYLHLNELNHNKAMSRMIKRFFNEGRFIDPELVGNKGNKPSIVFDQIKERSDFNGYSKWNNDVERGQRPRAEDFTGTVELFVEYGKTWRGSRNPNAKTDERRKTGAEKTVTDNNVRYSLKDARLTDERIDRIIREYGASNPSYAQAYVATINPRDFLTLTLKDESYEKWNRAAEEGTDREMYSFDAEKMKNQTQTPFLIIDTESGEVQGHEGRHRMRALHEAGVKEVPILIIDYGTKYSKQKESSMDLTSQDFGNGNVNNGAVVTVRNLIPTNKVYQDEIKAVHGGNADIRYSLKDLTEEDYSTIKEFFGTTNNYKVAGYLLKDGSMLDFSGKHWGNPNPYMRTVDHRDIWDVWENPDTDGYDEMVNMIGNGNIRLMPEVGGINLAVLPTKEQMDMLKGYIKNFGGKVVVDIDEIGGNTIESFGYDKGTSADSILGDIEGYFKKGNKHQSDLMAFHTKFSLKEDAEPENSNNLDQSEMYKAQVEALSGIFEVTKGKNVKTSSLRSVASMIRKRYNSTYDYNHLVNDLRIIYDYASSGKVAVNDLMAMTQMLSKLVLQESANNREISAEAKALLKDIKATRIMLSDAQKEEIAYYYDSFNEYRKKNFGKLTIANNGTSLDTVWKQFSETHPEWFDADVSELDQPMRLAEIVQALSEDYRSEEGFDIEDASTYMALELFNSYFIALDSQISEQHKAEINRLKSKYSTRMSKIKEQAKAKYEAKLQEVKQADRERLSKLRTTKNAKLEEQRAKFAMKKREAVSKVRENAAKAKVKKSILKNAKDIITWINAPTDKKHVPEAMRKVTLDFLTSIDFVSANAKPDSQNTLRWKDKMDRLKMKLMEVESSLNSDNETEYDAIINDIDPDLVPMITDFITKNEGKANISELDVAQLEELSKIVKSLKAAIVNANKMYANKMAESVAEIGNASIEQMGNLREKRLHGGLAEGIYGLLNVEMLDSKSYFEMLGESASSIYQELRDGFSKIVFDIKDAQEYMNEVLKGIKTKKWTGNNAELHTFKDVDGKVFTMTTAQLMSLYCLSKREQALGHIYGGGIKIENINASKKISQIKAFHIDEQMLADMVKVLTPEQIKVADAMQEYLSTTASEWGNEVSMQMFGYKKFNEKNYFPIKSYDNNLATNDKTENKNGSLYAIRNQGMTKATVKNANNALVISDVFDVFTEHIVGMANYHAFAIPLSDAMKWYNYKVGTKTEARLDTYSVKESIERAYGNKAKAYFTNLIRNINGEVAKGTSTDIPNMLMSKYKASAVAANIRVVIQQPTAYFRAMNIINPKHLAKGVIGVNSWKDSFEECKKYSAIGIWKSWGYYETLIGKSMKEVITGQQTVYDAIQDVAMKPAQLADDITWGLLWNAVKSEQMEAHPGMDIHSEEFMKLVSARFDEVIDTTQVVDTVLHKSQIMRSGDGLVKLGTAFMAEPTKSYNMVHNQMMKIWQNPKSKDAWMGLTRATSSFVITALFTAVAQSLVDSFRYRDEEEYEKWIEQYVNELKDNFVDNVNPLGLIPYAKDLQMVISALFGEEYYESSRMDTAALTQVATFITQMKKYISGDSNYTLAYMIKSGSKVLSYITGIPFYNVFRTINTLYDNIAENPLPMKKSDVEKAKLNSVIKELEKNGKADFSDLIKSEKEKYMNKYPTASDNKAEESATSSIRSKVTSEYKDDYIKAFKNGYSSQMREIKKKLNATKLYEDVDDTVTGWVVSALKTEYMQASTHEERTRIRQLLYRTGKWSTVRELDKQLEEWRN